MRSARLILYTAAGTLGVLMMMIPGLTFAEAGPPTDEDASGQTRAEIERWLPSFGIYSGAIGQQVEGSVSSCCDLNGVMTGTAPLRPSATGNDLAVVPFVGGTIELMTPGWASIPGEPRIFFHGDASALFNLDRDLAREGSPDRMVDPMRAQFSSLGVEGQGSKTTIDYESLMMGGGLGFAFSFDLWDRRIRIKPSIEYMRNEVTISGQVNRAQQVHPGNTATFRNSTFRFVELEGEVTRAFHGIGPGLELEMDAARAGPVMMTVFASAQAYHWLGDRTVSAPASRRTRVEGPAVTFPPPFTRNDSTFPNDETANFNYKQNRWGYRGGVGIRFRWQPE